MNQTINKPKENPIKMIQINNKLNKILTTTGEKKTAQIKIKQRTL